VLPDIDDIYIESAFIEAPESKEDFWIGKVQGISKGRELIPIDFYGARYLVAFLQPVTEAGDQNSLVVSVNIYADGFMPNDNSRVVKFWRADAEILPLDPSHWKLKEPTKMAAFCRTLCKAVALHAFTFDTCSQYFYLPANEDLDRLYGKLHKKYFGTKTSAYLTFQPILKPPPDTMGFCGYERI